MIRISHFGCVFMFKYISIIITIEILDKYANKRCLGNKSIYVYKGRGKKRGRGEFLPLGVLTPPMCSMGFT